MTELRASFRKPFAEQVTAFRLRLGDLRPTSKWTDVWQEGHDRAFMVAGAVKADLLSDLAGAVDKAIAGGTTLEEFRRDFRQIVDTHGWHGWTGEGTKGGEAWRTRVIYKTNMATSYAAGRMAQLIEGEFAFWVYRHGGSREPRIQHLDWDGLILPPDHPFWATHAPPNGWGCSCYIVGAYSLAGARRIGGNDTLQLGENWAVNLAKTGAPAGIDKGWAYAPGASVAPTVSAMADKVVRWPYDVAKAFMQEQPVDVATALSTRYRALKATGTAVSAYGKVAESGTSGAAFKTLGLLTAGQVGQAKQVLGGLDVSGFDFALDGSRLKDVLKEAAASLKGAPVGFDGLGQLLNRPAEWKSLGTSKAGRPLVQLTVELGGQRYVMIYEVMADRKTLALVSIGMRL